MMKSLRWVLVVLTLIGMGAMGAGCFSTLTNNPALDVMESMANPRKTYVEAYIEYQGPDEKWAGPATFLIHINAKEEKAVIKVVQSSRSGSQGMASEVAREYLDRIASAIYDGDLSFRGCLTPLRVRMIRSDGAVLDKSGCRSSTGWPKVVSEVVDLFMEASLNGSGSF